MEVLKTLAVALSLGTLAGVNLYLTVLVTGLALHFDWVILPSQLASWEGSMTQSKCRARPVTSTVR